MSRISWGLGRWVSPEDLLTIEHSEICLVLAYSPQQSHGCLTSEIDCQGFIEALIHAPIGQFDGDEVRNLR
jgi:hypothetical protein